MNVRHPITGCAYQSITGDWGVEPIAFSEYSRHAALLDLRELAKLNAEAEAREKELAANRPVGEPAPKPYDVVGDTAVIHVTGPTSQQPTSFSRLLGGTATTQLIRATRAAVADPQVGRTIAYRYETPGGTIAGSAEMVDAIRWAKQHKRVIAHIDNLGASCGMLYASQAHRVTANRTATVGSIGVIGQPLVDSSAAATLKGLRFYYPASGKWKAMGLDGRVVTDEERAEADRRVNAVADDLIADVASARRLSPGFIRSLEAAVFTAKEGRERNLIDDVCSFEQALADAA